VTGVSSAFREILNPFKDRPQITMIHFLQIRHRLQLNRCPGLKQKDGLDQQEAKLCLHMSTCSHQTGIVTAVRRTPTQSQILDPALTNDLNEMG
jgi:hypothetical protein